MFIKGWELLAKFEGKAHPMAIISDWKKIESFECSLVERSSDNSFGLQIVDVCLWILRRVVDNKNEPRGQCRVLFQCLVERSMIAELSFDNLLRVVKQGVDYVDNLPLTEAQLEKGREVLKELEASRQNRLLQSSNVAKLEVDV
jgi:hypothetical protein